MLARLKWPGAVASFFAAAAVAVFLTPAKAQAPSGEPVKIGFSMALTGPLAANGKQALLGAKIWQEEVNAKGGCSAGKFSSSITMISRIRRRYLASTPSSSTSINAIWS